ncbi:serine/threonine protein kinase [Streptomyces sp. SP2-10]|nr:serine/threonine-protein kinase [Streptomyces sp. SP2-10]MBY8842894.1 serine/threonine protein kinase [Streptomyces sp. SP2-10]
MQPLLPGDPAWVGGYRLLGRLGEGGMGRVYLGRAKGGRAVAVKVVQREYAQLPEFRARFAREAEAARQVDSAWTAPVLEADTDAAVPWVATAYVPGPDLHTVVSELVGPLPEPTVTALGNGLAQALRDIHAAGLIHRDLKPSNILVTVDGPSVIDFGIARAFETLADEKLTRTGAVVGSPAFMSPEQVRGHRLTPASDVFSWGSVMAFAATGRSPFGTSDGGLHALLFRVAEEEPNLSGLPSPIRSLVASCLAKDPEDRPAVGELIAHTEPTADPWLPASLLAHLGREIARVLHTDVPSGELQNNEAPTGRSKTVTPADTPTATATLPAVPARRPLPPSPSVPEKSRQRFWDTSRRRKHLYVWVLAAALTAAVVPVVTFLDGLGRPSSPFAGSWELNQPVLGGTYRRLEISSDSTPGGSPVRVLFTNSRGNVLCKATAPVLESSSKRLALGKEKITETVPARAERECVAGRGESYTAERQGRVLRRESTSTKDDSDTALVKAAGGSRPIGAAFLGNWSGSDTSWDSPYKWATVAVHQGEVGSITVSFVLSGGGDGKACKGDSPLLSAKDDSLRLGPADFSSSSALGCSPVGLAASGSPDELTLLLSGNATITLHRTS